MYVCVPASRTTCAAPDVETIFGYPICALTNTTVLQPSSASALEPSLDRGMLAPSKHTTLVLMMISLPHPSPNIRRGWETRGLGNFEDSYRVHYDMIAKRLLDVCGGDLLILARLDGCCCLPISVYMGHLDVASMLLEASKGFGLEAALLRLTTDDGRLH